MLRGHVVGAAVAAREEGGAVPAISGRSRGGDARRLPLVGAVSRSSVSMPSNISGENFPVMRLRLRLRPLRFDRVRPGCTAIAPAVLVGGTPASDPVSCMSFTDRFRASISRTELSSSLKYGSSMVAARDGVVRVFVALAYMYACMGDGAGCCAAMS